VLIEIEATPINPSDLGLMFGAADVASARAGERNGHPSVILDLPAPAMAAMASRAGQWLAVGNEACGRVVEAGSGEAAQALLGKRVGTFGGEMFAGHRCVAVQQCLPLPDSITPAQGASCFVNPMTALGFVETMRMEGHKAIVHTAAASNLGQMLNRICLDEEIPLVNIVRSEAQQALLRDQGAQHVLNSSDDDFSAQLAAAVEETGATLAYDAIGGGKLANQILMAMEAAAQKRMPEWSRYGSDEFKQVYIYGALDLSPTQLNRGYGFAWSLGGWLLTPFLQRAGLERLMAMQQRVVSELTTTFASHYAHNVSLADSLSVSAVQQYGVRKTGQKTLITAVA
jgi:NADPH2:quinone reductase